MTIRLRALTEEERATIERLAKSWTAAARLVERARTIRAAAARARRIQADPRWRYFELATGHNLHYSAPKETVAILRELVGG